MLVPGLDGDPNLEGCATVDDRPGGAGRSGVVEAALRGQLCRNSRMSRRHLPSTGLLPEGQHGGHPATCRAFEAP